MISDVNTINKVIKFIETMPSPFPIPVLNLEYSDTGFKIYHMEVIKEGV